MKTITFKNGILLILGVLAIWFWSCSKETVDNIGRDTALNIIRTGSWKSWVKTVSGASDPDLNVTVQLLEEGETLNFDRDGAWHKKNDGTGESHKYSMPTTQSMVFEGVEYQIQENIVSSINTLTLVHKDGEMTTTLIFKRNR